MKCPYCSKEIKDDAVFCGFCGKQIPQKPLEETFPSPPVNEVKELVVENSNNVPAEVIEESQQKRKPKKKRTTLKIWLIFVLLAFISGSVLGFLTARGVISLDELMPGSTFKWTSFSEGQSEPNETDETLEYKETDSSEETQATTENGFHYAKYVGGSLVVTNDMFGRTLQEFADDYFVYVLILNEVKTELIADGYLF